MNNRPFVLITPQHMQQKNKNELTQAIKNASKTEPRTFSYSENEDISPECFQEVSNAKCIYAFYDPTSDSRKKIGSLLQQADNKNNICLIPFIDNETALTDEVDEIAKRFVDNAKKFKAQAQLKPICFERTANKKLQTVQDFKTRVQKQNIALSSKDEIYGVVDDPNLQNQVAAAPSVLVAPEKAFVNPQMQAMLTVGAITLHQSIAAAEEKLRLAKEELKNLEVLKTSAAKASQAYSAGNTQEYNTALIEVISTTAKIQDGRGDLKNLIIGAALFFLGVALMATSIPLFLYLPPAAVVGTELSLNILAAAAAFLAGSALAIGFGVFAIKNREQGVVKESHRLTENIRNLTFAH